MTRHARFWVGELAREAQSVVAWERVGHRAVRVALCISLFVLYILLIVFVNVHFVCCSVKLLLSRTHKFFPFSFHSPPHPSGRRGDRATMWSFVASHGQTATVSRILQLSIQSVGCREEIQHVKNI